MSSAAVLQLIDQAPAFAEPQPLSAEDLRKAGLAALDVEIQRLRASQGDDRQAVLSEAAHAAGAIAGAGAIVETFAKALIDAAALEVGLIKDIGTKAVKATITAAMKAGKKVPRDFSTGILSQPRPGEAGNSAAVHVLPFPPEAGDSEPSLSSFSSTTPPDPLGVENEQEQTLADDDDGDDLPPDDEISEETFRYCATLDHSDVDNGKRLLAYFGRDILVRQEDDVEAGQLLAWVGTHWDLSGGVAGARLVAQRVGDLIKREADFIEFAPAEQRTINAGEAAAKELKDLDTESDDPEVRRRIGELTDLIKAARKARSARSSRRANHRKWGVSSKNAGKISNMLKEAAPHLRRHPDAFNADPLKVATLTHTLSFVPKRDPDDPEPEGRRPLVDRASGRVQYELHAKPGHDRDDMLTAVIPFAWKEGAPTPKFDEFLDLFQPEIKKRQTVQQFSGMSLTAQPVQRVMFHTGTGGNGKSVFLEVLSRVLGDGLAVGLPAESISGQVQNNPSAPTPDIARCYAKRHIRIAELPKDAPLKVETIKKLTGGERWPVRTMYKGYFEFKPTAKPHMSGNGEPKFDGADGGMRRRLIIVEWSVTLPQEKHRDFEDVVSDIVAEGSGILNWLIAGALEFLNGGLIVSEDVLASTAAHFAEMDPCQQFADAHVRPDPEGPGVPSREMYNGYKLWCEANGKSKMFETRFGRTMKNKFTRDDSGRVHVYVGVKLVDLPESSHHAQGPPPATHHVPPEDREF